MAKSPTEASAAPLDANKPMCGLVMPIAAMGDYTEGHWVSVERILRESITDVGFDAKLVSQETVSGVIHQRIVTNLYSNPLVVCDVSGRNPNVMFELGMRLAFDKPTIIVKDDDTPFSFDISGIEHVQYSKSLSYGNIVEFKEELGKKIVATAKAAESPEYSTFLRHIGGIVPSKLDIKEVPLQEFMSKQMEQIMVRLDRLDRTDSARTRPSLRVQSPKGSTSIGVISSEAGVGVIKFVVHGLTREQIDSRKADLFLVSGVIGIQVEPSEEGIVILASVYDQIDEVPSRIASIITNMGGQIEWQIIHR